MFKGIAFAALAAAIMAGAQTSAESAQKVRFNFTSEAAAEKSRYKGKKVVKYRTALAPGTIVISTRKRKLYLVMEGGKAMEYGVGVGRQGFNWSGGARIARKAEWPAWRPPEAMRKREPHLPAYMEGGPKNPLGARALYLYQGNVDTLYRIHGTSQPHTIGLAVSSGCIRMLNEEVIDLYQRVKVGARVVVN
ncbi:MAG: L,D-transpeptidase [Hyphomicrobiales bacterium]